MTVPIEMGQTTAGAPAALDIEELLATRLLVQGNSGSGKSHLLRRLLEQSAQWVQQVIIDPEGDFLTLEGLDIEQQMRAAAAFLNGMFDADREFWYPVLVVVDEAQMFAPSVGGD